MHHVITLSSDETAIYDSGDQSRWADIRRRIYAQARAVLATEPGAVEFCLCDGTVIDYMRAEPTDTQCTVGITLDD